MKVLSARNGPHESLFCADTPKSNANEKVQCGFLSPCSFPGGRHVKKAMSETLMSKAGPEGMGTVCFLPPAYGRAAGKLGHVLSAEGTSATP